MKKVLITGGFGFIGSHLIEWLLKAPNRSIHVLDNLATTSLEIAPFLERFEPGRITHDICSVQDFFKREKLPRFDEVYHLASVVGPVGVIQTSVPILKSIVQDTYSVAEYCVHNGAKLCDISTSEIYGGGRNGLCVEGDSAIITSRYSRRLEYAVAKLASEVALVNMTGNGLHATIVRPFNVAGPRQSEKGGFVLPRFINQAKANIPLTVYGDGTMVRAFTNVRDIVRGIAMVMERGEIGESYNVGNPDNRITILNLAKTVIDLSGSKSEIAFVDPKKLWGPRFEEASDKYPDASKISNLGWVPLFSLEETIQQCL